MGRKYLVILVGLFLAVTLCAQDTAVKMGVQQSLGPDKAEDFPSWLDELAQREIGFAWDLQRCGVSRAELQWTQRSFHLATNQMVIEKRDFYDPVAKQYTVDRNLDDLEKRSDFYPNIGIDDRNENHMLSSVPGGIRPARPMLADLHRRGKPVARK